MSGVEYGLAKDWLSSLAKSWKLIKRERAQEIGDIANNFCDPELLRRRYIEPDCQPTNPADYHEDEPIRVFRTPVREWLNRFLQGQFLERDGRNIVFILGDAGMGKTSLLVMLKFSHLMRFWPVNVDFRLLKLGPDVDSRIRAIDNKRNTVLLLDALDEDQHAIGRVGERLVELLDAASPFRQVLVTCRTQYFPDTDHADFGKINIGGFACNLIYLSPLSERQIEAYINNVFRRALRDYWGASASRRPSRWTRARTAVLSMRSLRMRPLLLAYIEDLVDADLGSGSEYRVYGALIDRWLSREERNVRVRFKGRQLNKEDLWRVCQTVADFLNAKRSRSITSAELTELARRDDALNALSALDIGGRSLLNRKSDGSYRFAHYSIQEFFLAHRVITEPQQDDLSPYAATDQVINFFLSWYRESPRARRTTLRRFLELRREGGLSADLTGLDLASFDFTGCDLQGVNFSHSKLENAQFRDADLHASTFIGANLRSADFEDARLRKANLSRADLSNARFVKADITGAVFTDATLTNADFLLSEGAHLEDLLSRGARVHDASV